jgi:hypothetical protein
MDEISRRLIVFQTNFFKDWKITVGEIRKKG